MSKINMVEGRLDYLDGLKGFLILLVVLGHVIQKMYCPEQFDENLLFRMIYSFHMPAFFCASGFVAKYDKIEMDLFGKVIVKRFKQLIIPFLTWGIIWHLTFHETILFGFFKAPDNSLWFLWDLFWIVFVYNIALFFWAKIPKINGIFWVVGGFFALKGLTFLFGSTFGIRSIADYYLFYIVGVMLGVNKDKIFMRNGFTPYITCLLLLFFLCLSSLWYRYQCVPETESPLVQSLNNFSIYRRITPLIGCVSFVYIFYLLTPAKPHKLFWRAILYLGMNTLAIYAVHQSVIWAFCQLFPQLTTFMTTIWGFLISVVVVVFGSLIIMYLLKSNKVISLLFLG